MIEQREEQMSIDAMCEVLNVSLSDYYGSQQREVSVRQEADARLGHNIERVFLDSCCTYGHDRIHQKLRCEDIRTKSLTRKGDLVYIVANLLQQDLTATACNQMWVIDNTYISTRKGWLYLVSVMDLCSCQNVGWAIGDHHDAQLATRALDMAIHQQRPALGIIVHSDRVSEFANTRLYQRAKDTRTQLSMSSTGNYYDNVAESVSATIKLEFIQDHIHTNTHNRFCSIT